MPRLGKRPGRLVVWDEYLPYEEFKKPLMVFFRVLRVIFAPFAYGCPLSGIHYEIE
jgi:hypothetical protein